MRFVMVILPLLGLGCSGEKDDPTFPTMLGPVEVTDRVLQTLTTPVDVLWVVDGGFRAAIDSFDEGVLTYAHEILLLSDPDWRQGILDSTAGGQNFGLIGLKWETYPYPPTAFRQPNPGGPPRMREAVYTALELRKTHSANSDFIRSTAHLYVIMLTDREDESDDGVVTKRAFDEWFAEFQPSESTRMSALTTGDVAGYWENRLLGGGTLFEAGSFRRGMEALLLDAIGQTNVFPLSAIPVTPPGVVHVWYREHKTEYVIDLDYTYDAEANAVVFLDAPPRPNAEVVMTYQSQPGSTPATATTETTTSTPE